MASGTVWAIRLLLAGALAFAIFSINPAQIIGKVGWPFAVAIVFVQAPFLLGIFVQGMRHAFLIGDSRLTPWIAFKAMLIAAALNYLVPGQLAEVTKASYVAARSDIPMDAGVSATLLGRLLDLIAVSIVATVAGIALGGGTDVGVLSGLAVLLVCVVAALPFLLGAAAGVITKFGWNLPASFVGHLALAVRGQSSPQRFATALIFSIVSWTLFGLGVGLFLFIGGSADLNWSQTALLVAALAFGASIPIFPGAIGTYEAAAVIALMQFGVPAEVATLAAIGIRICNVVCVLPVGLFLAHKEGVGLRELMSRKPR